MRVLHVASSFPLHDGSGVAPFMAEMLSASAQRGHQVRIIVPHAEGLQKRSDVTVVPYRYAPRPFQTWGYGKSLNPAGTIRASARLVAPFAVLAMIAKTRREITKWQPDVIHLHWLLPQGALAKVVGPDLPVVVSLHGADVPLAKSSSLFRRVARSVLNRADHLVAASGGMFERIAELDPSVRNRASVILHGADSRLFTPGNRSEARHRLGIGANDPAVLAVGRLMPKKGFDRLIRAMSDVADPRAHVYIAGDGPSRSDLVDLAHKLAPDRITFLGTVDRSTLSDWYAACDIVVVPSVDTKGDIDSGPVVLMEALASGRGAISTPQGMAPTVIEDGSNGYLISEADPGELAGAISLALPEADRLGRNAAETFKRIGDWSRVAQELEVVYETAMRRRKAASSR